MLKITCQETETEQHWILSGRLSGPWVGELRCAWEQAQSDAAKSHRAKTPRIDMTEVVSVDEKGEHLLRTMQADGARFAARGVCMKHILANLRNKAKPALRRALAHLDDDAI